MRDKNGNLKILKMISKLIRGIRQQQINLKIEAFYENLESNTEDKEEMEIVNTIFLQIQEMSEQFENISWLNKHYRILHEFAQTCSKTLNEDILLNKAYDMVSQVMSTDSFYIALYNEGDIYIQFAFLMDNGKFYPQELTNFGDNYTSEVIRTRKIIHLQKATQPEELNASFGENETSSCLFIPIIIDDHVKGVISAQSYSDFAYRKEHEELLQIIGTQVINSIETARLYKKIYLMSQTDELTGLKNQRAFHKDLSRHISEENQKITLMMIDSDNLKKVNDNYGHDTGDLYLKVLAEGIKSISSEEIEGYRYAGDEFMIIIKSASEQVTEQLYEKLIAYYSLNPIDLPNNRILVSISAGVAYYPHHGPTADSLKKSADTALYLAKKQNRNQLVIADY